MFPNVIEWVASNLRELIPVKTIRTYQKGIKYTFGLLGGFRDWQKQRGYYTEFVFEPVITKVYDIQWNEDIVWGTWRSWRFPYTVSLNLIKRFGVMELRHKPCQPGWEWYVPFAQQVEIIDVAEETYDLLVQSVTTKDFRKVTFSANIVWRVKDAISYMNDVQDVEKSMEGASRVFCSRQIRKWTFQELIDRQDELEAELKKVLNKFASGWGIKIEEVGFTDFVETEQYRLFGDAPYLKS